MKYIFILIFFCISLSLKPAFAASKYPYDELEILINKLNVLSGLTVTYQETKECGFRLMGKKWEDESPVISFCENDLKPFAKDSFPQYPSKDLFSIIAHEYAHALVDYDRDIEDRDYTEEKIEEVASYFYQQLSTQGIWNPLLQAILSVKSPDDSDEDHITSQAYNALNLADHENIDTLGVKLLLILGYEPSETQFARLQTNSDAQRREVKNRQEKMRLSISEGLHDWKTYNCTGLNSFSRTSSGDHFKKILMTQNLSKILESVNRECSTEEAFKTSIDTLYRYHSAQ